MTVADAKNLDVARGDAFVLNACSGFGVVLRVNEPHEFALCQMQNGDHLHVSLTTVAMAKSWARAYEVSRLEA